MNHLLVRRTLLGFLGASLAMALGTHALCANESAPQPATPPSSATPTEPPPPPFRRVLLAGDSMVGARCCLSRSIEETFGALGTTVVSDAWNGVTIGQYAKAPRLAHLLQRHQPDLVILTLGTNDVTVPHPEALGPAIVSIVRRLGKRRCVWLGPPTWTTDTGIVDVIRQKAAPCQFIDSRNLSLERIRDGIHLTDEGGAAWARHFFSHFKI